MSINHFNGIERAIEGIIILVFCLGYYIKELTDIEEEDILKSWQFWMFTGFLTYFSGTLFLFLYGIKYMDEESFFSNWLIHTFLNLILNLLLAISLWKGRHRQI
ncbi:MAG: hypothetical protein HUJ25_09955 [Crocinitomicaceae bacterium]|nr:hypothetical protein [Crocinitomicaceae bacterium]